MASTHTAVEVGLQVADLRYSYGDREVLRGVDLAVQSGEVYALLGPNGAGKTTTIEVIVGLRRPCAGRVRVLGTDPVQGNARWRGRLGVVVQGTTLHADLTVSETLDMFARHHGPRARPGDLIKTMGLGHLCNTRVRALSRGQNRRLDLAIALVGRPEVLVLDEPTSGMDPTARLAAWRLIKDHRTAGKATLLVTQALDEATAIADRIGVLVGGRIALEAKPKNLATKLPSEIRFALATKPSLKRLPAHVLRNLSYDDRYYHLPSRDPAADVATLTAWARRERTKVVFLEVRPPDLEDIYLGLTDG